VTSSDPADAVTEPVRAPETPDETLPGDDAVAEAQHDETTDDADAAEVDEEAVEADEDAAEADDDAAEADDEAVEADEDAAEADDDAAEADDEAVEDDEADEADDLSGRRPVTSRSALSATSLAAFGVIVLAIVVAFGAGIVVGRSMAPYGTGWAVEDSPATTAAVSGADASAQPGAAASPQASDPLAGLPADGALLGSKTAKTTLTYWADYQCPFCSAFAKQILPQLASRIADGTVAVEHRDFVFLGPESLTAAVAVRCAGEQGKYWPMHDAVYAAQAGENQGAFDQSKLTQIAASVGLDAGAFAACTARHDVLVSVLADTAAGTRAGVTSTPTLELPGKRFQGVPNAADFLAAIDAAASTGATPTPAPSAAAPAGDPWSTTPTKGLTAGSPSAPVTVELWVDDQATGMPDLVTKLEPELRKRVATGKVKLVLRDLATLGDESVVAATFVRCAAQDGEPATWFAQDIAGASAQGANAGVFDAKSLLWLGAKLGFDVPALDACMADPATASAVRSETAIGTGIGLTAAPAVVVKTGGKERARFFGSSLDQSKVLAAVDAAAK
jgi:protein-disulfide isomerase